MGIANAISSGSAVTLANVAGATLNLNGFNDTISSLAGGGTTGGNVTLGSGTLTTGNSTATTFSGIISGTGGLTKVGTGTFTVTGANTYTGATTISAGTLQDGSNTAVPAGIQRDWDPDSLNSLGNGASVTNWVDGVAGRSATNVGNAPTLTTNAINGHSVVTFNSGLSEALQVAAADSPMVGATQFTIGFVFRTSTIGVNSANQWYLNTGLVNAEQPGVTNDWGIAFTNTGQVAAGIGNPDTTNNSTTSGLANGTPHIVVETWNAGTITLDVDGVVTTTTGAGANPRNSFRFVMGSLDLLAGQYYNGNLGEVAMYNTALTGTNLAALYTHFATKYGLSAAGAAANAIPDTSAVTVAGPATLDLHGFNETIGSLTGSGSVTLGSGTLTTGNSTATTFSGMISGTGGLTKVGTGTFTLTGTNTYSGTTTISAGTLQISNGGTTGTLGTGAVTDNATLFVDLSSSISVTNAISGSGTLTLYSAAGAITQSTAITVATLSANASTGITLNSANAVSNFSATDSSSTGVSLTNTATTLTVTGIIELGSGSVSVSSTGNLTLAAPSIISTVSGGLTLQANTGGTASGSFSGINVVGATVQSATGNVLLQGTGGNGSGGFQCGISIQIGGVVRTTGTGTVTIQGTGGASSGPNNYGIYDVGTVTSGGGNVSVIGQGGGIASSAGDNFGVDVNAPGQVTAGGSGTVTVQGIGGLGFGVGNDGVLITGDGSTPPTNPTIQVTFDRRRSDYRWPGGRVCWIRYQFRRLLGKHGHRRGQ